MPLINCEVPLTLNWSKNCVLTSTVIKDDDPDADPAVDEINSPTNRMFQ